ncbi:hypothetical protein JKF63_00866 [Porcisia hertigi]|uniref:Uncharacterized protein n=1 Tax=Porcisia hertigi TaxID=2761500 RepID=A0A836KXK1_9TRYP|nr:hypothetical protein JKF63_00866 [Porcisia hertigi]
MTQETSTHQNGEPMCLALRQRARKNRSGENAARVIVGLDVIDKDAEVRTPVGRHHGVAPRDNYGSPTEFFGGPRQPPRQCSGIRRNPESNRDTVGLMLTDEYLMIDSGFEVPSNGRKGTACNGAPRASVSSTGASYGTPAKRGEGAARERKARIKNRSCGANTAVVGNFRHPDGLTNNCIVTAAEAPWRCGVRMTQPQDSLGAPYFEDNNPLPPRDTPALTGKRHIKPPFKDAEMFGQMRPLEGEENSHKLSLLPCHKTSNKANESVDVLNLYTYTAEELNEKPQPHKQLGPRMYVPPDMPPRKPAAIKPINTPAKEEHDVLGTGRWGVPPKEHPHGLARGSCRPPHDTANLFYGGMPGRNYKGDSHQQNGRSASLKKREDPVFDGKYRSHKQLCKKNADTANILRYYDPSVDPTPEKPPVRPVSRVNMESKLDDLNTPYVIGKARGEFHKNSVSSISLM